MTCNRAHAPEWSERVRRLHCGFGLRCGLGVDDLAVRRRVDANGARLHGFRNLTHQIDMQEAVLQLRGLHLDKVGEPKYALERSCTDTSLENFGLLASRSGL